MPATGISETAIWEKDGMYLSPVAGENITLGQVVEVGSTADYVMIGTDGSLKPLGVAIAGYRTSRIATDNVVASGNRVTVATRGVVNVTAAGTVTLGGYVQSATSGQVIDLAVTTVTTDVNKILGIALSGATTSGQTVKIKLLRG